MNRILPSKCFFCPRLFLLQQQQQQQLKYMLHFRTEIKVVYAPPPVWLLCTQAGKLLFSKSHNDKIAVKWRRHPSLPSLIWLCYETTFDVEAMLNDGNKYLFNWLFSFSFQPQSEALNLIRFSVILLSLLEIILHFVVRYRLAVFEVAIRQRWHFPLRLLLLALISCESVFQTQ